MTVANQFWSFQSLGAPTDVSNFALQGFASPNLARIYKFAKGTYGGQNLGYYPNPRNIRNGTTKSTHAWGALDWRYMPADPNAPSTYTWPGRDIIFDEFVPMLINFSAELGVQAIHDYLGDRIWRPPFTSGRGADGWKKQNGRGSGMGASWAGYIHVEVHPTAWFDDRNFAQAIGGLPQSPPPVIPPPPPVIASPRPVEEIMLQISSRPLVVGSVGPDVQFFQGISNRVAGTELALDGRYGPATRTAIENWQRFFGLYVDGKCGEHTQTSMIQVSLAAGK